MPNKFLTEKGLVQQITFIAEPQDLFSFPIAVQEENATTKELIQLFKPNIERLNGMALGSLPTEQDYYDLMSQLLFMRRALECIKEQNKDYNYFQARLFLAEWICSGCRFEELKQLVLFLANIEDKNEEMFWYYGYCLGKLCSELNNVNEAFLLTLCECINHLHSKNHRDFLLMALLKYYEGLRGYPRASLLEHLPEDMREFNGFFAHQRHEFILQNYIRNRIFFNIDTSILLEKSFLQKVDLEIPLRTGNIKITLTPDLLFKFSAHHKPPSLAIPKFDGGALSEKQAEKVDTSLRRKLHAAGLADSTGQLKKYFSYSAFCACLREALEENHPEFSRLSMAEKDAHIQHHNPRDLLEKMQSTLEAIRKKLSGMESVEALGLFYLSLIEHSLGLPSEQIEDLEKIILNSLSIYVEAEKISKLDHTKKHKDWLKLAEKIYLSLRDKPRNMLIALGAPIREKKKDSTHALYIAFKLEKASHIRIIIVNGGSGVEELHEPSPNQHPDERKEYKYAALAPINIKDPNYEEILIHYIYRLISLEYINSIKENDENFDNLNSYNNLLRNIYMRLKNPTPQPIFLGESGKIFTPLERQDLDECFLSQITGNCTIHNLKKALQILFDMDTLTFGLLEDTISLGIEQLAKNLITELDIEELKPNISIEAANNNPYSFFPYVKREEKLPESEYELIKGPLEDAIKDDFSLLFAQLLSLELLVEGDQQYQFYSIKNTSDYCLNIKINDNEPLRKAMKEVTSKNCEIEISEYSQAIWLSIRFPATVNVNQMVSELEDIVSKIEITPIENSPRV